MAASRKTKGSASNKAARKQLKKYRTAMRRKSAGGSGG